MKDNSHASGCFIGRIKTAVTMVDSFALKIDFPFLQSKFVRIICDSLMTEINQKAVVTGYQMLRDFLFSQNEQINTKNTQAEETQCPSVASSPGVLQSLLRIECPGFPSVLINQTTGDFETCLFDQDSTASKLYTSSTGHHILLVRIMVTDEYF